MQAGRFRHVLILLVHREESVHHHEDLPSCDTALLRLSLFRLGFLDFLSQEMGISWDALHQCCKEQRIETDKSSRSSKGCEGRFRFLTLQCPPIGLCAK